MYTCNRNYDAELYSFGKRLHETFEPILLQKALTEQSYVYKLQEEQKSVGIEVDQSDIDSNKEMIKPGEKLINDFVLLYTRHVLPYFPEEGIQ